ncbi:MAG TPA: hypothetical protein VFS62_08280 [Chloroflexota bacterium]|nr:hypothetical protein [Chloroflexota bacterium]
MSVSPIANVQLNILQLPEVARLEMPVLAQAQLANAQMPAIIAHGDREAAETIQVLREVDRRAVTSATDGATTRDRPSYRQPVRRSRLQAKVPALAAAHPRGIGQLVDLRA